MGLAPVPGEHISLASSGKIIARTADRFIGVTLDLWRGDDPQIGTKWGDASALSIELSPRFLRLAKGLSPGILRIGGSPQDSVAYQPVGGSCPERGPLLVDLMARRTRCASLDSDRSTCENARWGKLRCVHKNGRCRTTKWWAEGAQQVKGRRLAAATRKRGGRTKTAPRSGVHRAIDSHGRPLPATTVKDEYYCSQVHPRVYDCLTVQRWQRLNEFAAAADLSLVFGLNGCLGRKWRQGPVDVSAYARFFRDTAQAGLPVWGFELGNELTGVPLTRLR